ncbi:hypothetical protein EPI10_005163 [Gossypium australe]|uniref:Uncharacterized protein n=1 Tax=Gossypium australe TaxID=47621 RepID=A0A5B6WNY6_9ROSI|nr:hypothetical protein EPI10_005163 [Gossypium australe]
MLISKIRYFGRCITIHLLCTFEYQDVSRLVRIILVVRGASDSNGIASIYNKSQVEVGQNNYGFSYWLTSHSKESQCNMGYS